MSTFKNKNRLRTIKADISSEIKNNEARPKFTGCYKKECKHGPQLLLIIYSLLSSNFTIAFYSFFKPCNINKCVSHASLALEEQPKTCLLELTSFVVIFLGFISILCQ